MVGNAAKMPAVRDLVENTIHAKHLKGILKDVNPGNVVAVGAALCGAFHNGDIKSTVLSDVVPYSLGISVLKKDSKIGEDEISKLIDKNTRIPIKNTEDVLNSVEIEK